jgi:hypothetical protein
MTSTKRLKRNFIGSSYSSTYPCLWQLSARKVLILWYTLDFAISPERLMDAILPFLATVIEDIMPPYLPYYTVPWGYLSFVF